MEMKSSLRQRVTMSLRRLHLRLSGEYERSQQPIYTSVPTTSMCLQMTSRRLDTRTFCRRTFSRNLSSSLILEHRSVVLYLLWITCSFLSDYFVFSVTLQFVTWDVWLSFVTEQLLTICAWAVMIEHAQIVICCSFTNDNYVFMIGES